MILEYVEGEKLTHETLKELAPQQKTRFYKSLASIFIQLRRLEFGFIGRLVHRNGSFTVGNPVATIDINAQALEGLHPHKILR